MIREALNYPPSGKHGSRAVVVGGLFFAVLAVAIVTSGYLLSRELSAEFPTSEATEQALMTDELFVILIAVALFYLSIHLLVRGYYVAVLRTVVGVANPVAPRFRIRALVDGIKSALILFGYLVPALVLGGLGLFIRRPSTPETENAVINTVGAFAFLLGLFALIAAAYLVPAATALFAQQNSVRAAFEFSRVRTCVFTEDYAVGWVFAGVMRLIVVPIAILLEFILVGFFLRFYLHVSIQHLYAIAVTSALGLTADDSNNGGDTPAEDPLHPSVG
ncbi:DUF4013 domain-containing protein [Halocatena marina]|uniref:DUF4013 domain-containing protein n=1 Tax=Halocatena marina TaxID=2934937 RepID=A0ABD5YLU9_9EURY|nr:DUF4013 domain-containing protein [Halocatena marina]